LIYIAYLLITIMSDDDYYTALGLDKSDKESIGIADIKKAYKKMAVRYHPDKQVNKTDAAKTKAENNFKKISEAYQVLSDPAQKSNYDQYGKQGVKFEGFQTGFDNQDAFNIFEQFFGGGSSFSRNFGGFGRTYDDVNDSSTFSPSFSQHNFPTNNRGVKNKREVGADSLDKFQVTLKDFYSGCNKKIRVRYDTKLDKRDDVVDILVQPGWREGVKLTFEGMASCPSPSPTHLPGNLILELVEKSGSLEEFGFVRRDKILPFQLNGSKGTANSHVDLTCIVEISLSEAQNGISRSIKHMDGRTIQINHPKLNRSDDEVMIPGEGMPIRKKQKIVGKGDLYVLFKITLK
jgi:DnaJ family protein B protein 4